jgi:hypothetical protein
VTLRTIRAVVAVPMAVCVPVAVPVVVAMVVAMVVVMAVAQNHQIDAVHHDSSQREEKHDCDAKEHELMIDSHASYAGHVAFRPCRSRWRARADVAKASDSRGAHSVNKVCGRTGLHHYCVHFHACSML